jgi:hypothetical protein
VIEERMSKHEHVFSPAEVIALDAIAWKFNTVTAPLRRQIAQAESEHVRDFATIMRGHGLDLAKIPQGAKWVPVPGAPSGSKALVWDEPDAPSAPPPAAAPGVT